VKISKERTVLFVVNEAYFFMSHRIAVARALVENGCTVHVAVPADNVWAPNGFSIEEIEKAGFHLHIIPLSRRGKNILQDFATFISIFKLLCKLRPEVVHLFTIKPVIYGGLAARLAGCRSVISTITGLGHMFIAPGLLTRILRTLVIGLYRLATDAAGTRIIVQNKGDAEVLAGTGAVRPEKIRLVPGSGVNLAEFQAVPEPAGPALIILPSRLIWDKGVKEFAMAAIELKKQGFSCRFALVGDTHPSNPRAVPEEEIKAWVSNGYLEWWGRRTDMPKVFAQSAVVCLPTTYGEGLPKVLIEAAACGRPIITTDIPACREIVQHNENGLLVAPGNVDELVDAMKELLSSPKRRAKMGARGREIVASGLTEEHIVASTLDVYREVSDLL
jgi:glycosyltransferase involved in cell wall biosynthesis